MTQHSPFKRLNEMAKFVMQSHSRNQIISYLSSHISPYDELTGVGVALLDYEGRISVKFRFGFSDSIPPPPEISITDDHPYALTFRTLEIQCIDFRKIKEEFKDVNPGIKDNSEYISTIYVPATTDLVYGFAFTRDIKSFKNFEDYFQCVRTILRHWELAQIQNPERARKVTSFAKDLLTTRQEKVVELIKNGLTNSAIAAKLGYSESLVRQETISIYRKLGIEGRRELIVHGSALVG